MGTRISSREITTPERREAKNKKQNPIDYVSKFWIPISEKVLAEVKAKTEHGIYFSQPMQLFCDLKQDLGLYSWFLKNATSMLIAPVRGTSPTKIIENMDLEKCLQLLTSIDKVTFPHRLQGSLKVQSSSIKHAVICSATAETVAEHSEVDPELAYLCAMIRQIGMNLVAWNYPQIFSKAIQQASSENDNFERDLIKYFGHSPSELAASLCLDWDETEKIKSFIIPSKHLAFDSVDADSDESVPTEAIRTRLHKCLELGSSMARLADPEHFPKYARKWESTVDRLKQAIGSDALEKIQQKLAPFSEAYSADGFEFNVDLDPKKNLTQTSIFRVTDRLMSGNPLISKFTEPIQKKFRRIYTSIDKRSISTSAINLLISELVPELGFVKGCIYRFDENAMTLTPLLRIGETRLDMFEKLKCTSAKHMKHPAVVAITCPNPFIQEEVFVNNRLVSAIGGVFGEGVKKAVLYVELTKKNDVCNNCAALAHFKALQKTLADCLNLD